jgi:hypothetical protein
MGRRYGRLARPETGRPLNAVRAFPENANPTASARAVSAPGS